MLVVDNLFLSDGRKVDANISPTVTGFSHASLTSSGSYSDGSMSLVFYFTLSWPNWWMRLAVWSSRLFLRIQSRELATTFLAAQFGAVVVSSHFHGNICTCTTLILLNTRNA